jgi:hypothetical protein
MLLKILTRIYVLRPKSPLLGNAVKSLAEVQRAKVRELLGLGEGGGSDLICNLITGKNAW